MHIPRPDQPPRSQLALERLGISPDDLEKCPEISPTLDRALSAANMKKVGTGRVISFLRYSDDKQAMAVVQAYDEANKGDRDAVPIEALCLKAKANPITILGAAIFCARNISAQEAALTTIIEHPEVLKSTIQFAKELPGASKDREMIHQAIGFLPTSKGNSVNVNLFGGNAKFSDEKEEDDDDTAFSTAFENDNSELEQWGNQRRKLLEKGR